MTTPLHSALAEAREKLNSIDYSRVSRPFRGTKPETSALIPRIKELAERRLGVRRIADELGCSHTTVRKLALRNGITLHDGRAIDVSRRHRGGSAV